MCGICGELRFDGSPADKTAVARMSDKIARRGPDHAGAFSDGALAFGHRRLAIIDLSADGDQPMVDRELKLVLVFNGTIYLLGERVSQQVKVVLSGLEMVTPACHLPDLRDVTAELVANALAQPQADTFIDQVLRFDATTLVVDDPVKRVDNMAMAWGLEARVPFLDHELVELAARMPPQLRLKQGGKFPLKAISRGLISDAVIDRPKGYFPVPVLKHVSGKFMTFMRGILNSDACIQRGLYQRAYVDKLLAAPAAWLTRIQGSKLWHLALLELWLQLNVDAARPTE